MVEEWRAVEGFEGLYEVSNFGEVKALERYVENNGGMQHRSERILKPNLTGRYSSVVLCKGGKIYPYLIHRLVAETFIPNPQGKPVVDHIDTITRNNVVSNLRWVTISENCMNPLTRKRNSASKTGDNHWTRKRKKENKNVTEQSL